MVYTSAVEGREKLSQKRTVQIACIISCKQTIDWPANNGATLLCDYDLWN